MIRGISGLILCSSGGGGGGGVNDVFLVFWSHIENTNGLEIS